MEKITEKLKNKKFDCPLCQESLEIKFDKRKQKPYCQCNECGMQIFIRRERGINFLIEQTRGFLEF